MKFGQRNDKKEKKKSVGTLRKTQLITTFGPGSIAEMPEYTIIMGATDYWETKSPIIYETSLQRLLGVKYFKEPYTSESTSPMGNGDIPAFRFPTMHFCPKCGKLSSFRNFGDPKMRKCFKCNAEIVPSRFVVACVNGHLEDFPFDWWVHYGNPVGCSNNSDSENKGERNDLAISFLSSTGGLASIVVECKRCGSKRSMEGCMSKDALRGYKCRGRRPWIGFKSETNDLEECNAPMRALQRGASNVYFSITQSALTIPPWSNKIQTIIESKWDTIQNAFEQSIDDNMFKQLVQILFKDYIEEGKYSINDFMGEINKRRGKEDIGGEPFTEHMMFEDEYKALSEGYLPENQEEPEDFQAEITDISDFLEDYFEEVVLVKRLREVLALKGFRRITPTPPKENEDASIGANNNEFMTLWNKRQNWLPATEMRGEGIFIRLNEDKLRAWETLNSERYEKMGKRLGGSRIGKDMFSPRYVLLHTLSHLLIRQLTIDCGYQEAALKERIYSTYEDSDFDMAGILIYTSASDSDGSLGGLVRQGESDLLEETIRNALQEASWCSSDPLCSESESQGYDSLNYAACHACTLLPETSCEARNCLLDRAAVVGKNDDRTIGFMGELIGGTNNG